MRILSNLSVSGLLGLNSVADANTDTDKFLVLDSSGIVKYRTGTEVFNDIGAGGAASYTSTLQHEVKAGVALTKGQAVYVTSADGTNMIVSKASNVSEGTSSKTLGLIAQNLNANGKGFVITEGLLAGLDTSTALTEGDPVWLGTDGNLIYGLTNKPYAPAHLVFIGIVTRKSSNNGEIFVKVQNGFELQEIHNVQITSTPSDNTVLAYETSTSLYKMKSISTLLGYTPVTNARNITINGTTYDLSADRSWSVGTLTGTLNSGYVPKATGSTSLANGLIYDTGSAVLIGTQTAGSGKFMVYSTSPDNHYQAVGSAPSFRFADTITSPTYTGIFGLATASNHFIIGALAGDMVLSNNTTSSIGNFLFGTGATERMRISPAGNISINNTNNTYRLDVTGTVRFTGQLRLESTITNGTHTYTLPSATGTLALTSDIPTNPITGTGTINVVPKFYTANSIGDSNLFDTGTTIYNNNPTAGQYAWQFNGSTTSGQSYGVNILAGTTSADVALRILNASGSGEYLRVTGNGNLLVGTSTNGTFKLDVNGTARVQGVLTLSSTITNGTNTYTLPSATGTLALTSDIPSLSGYVPTSRTITINGVTYDLSADRSWTVAGGVGGSGTTNYLPKFTGASTIGNSQIFDNGTNVVIKGTTDGNLYVRAGSSAMSGGTGLGLSALNDAASALVNFNIQGNIINFVTGGSTAQMTLNASGNLSIGNTNDSFKLDVSGTGRFSGLVISKGSGAYNGGFDADNTGTTGGGIFRVKQNGVTSGIISARGSLLGNTDRNMAYSAEVGLGQYFYVNDSTLSLTLASTGAATFSSNVTAGGSVTIGTGGSYTTGSIYSDGSWGMLFRAKQASPSNAEYRWAKSDDSELMRISPSGGLQIGTTPDQGFKLDVAGTGRFSGNVSIYTAGYPALNLGVNSSNQFTWIYDNPNANLLLQKNGLTRITISETGATTFSDIVNAGTFAGNALNYIDGTNIPLSTKKFRAIQSRTNNDNGTVGLDLSNTQPTNGVYSPIISFSAISSGNVYNCTYAAIWGVKTADEGSWAAGDLIFGTANPYGVQQKMRILANGNVGINTSGPVTKLEVYDIDGSGARTTPFNVATITADNSSNPYNGFGAGLLFRNKIYSGGPAPGGIQNGARIRTSINTNSIVNDGTDLVFDTTTTGNGSLTETVRFSYIYGHSFKSSTYNAAYFNSTYGQSNIVIQNNGASFAVFGSGVSVCSTAGASDVGIGTAGGNNAIVFATSSSYLERMRITSGGNVVIGGTNAASRFNVRGQNSNSQIELDNFGGGSNYILSYDRVAAAYKDIVIITNSSNNTIYASTSGNVGIGTSSPADNLEVASGNYRGLTLSTPTSGNRPTITFRNTSGNNSSYIQGDGRALAFGQVNTDYGGHSESMRITSGGNVGIGTTSPSSIGTGYTTLDIQGSNGGGLFYGVSGNKAFLYADASGGSIGTNAALPYMFYTSGSERMRIVSGGNVGINTTNPQRQLDVASPSIAYIRTTQGTSSVFNEMYSTSMGGFIGTASSHNLALQTAGTTRMTITNGGLLFINTTMQVATGFVSLVAPLSTNIGFAIRSTNAGNSGQFMQFQNSSSVQAGAITHTGATTVAFTTTSDYRLKQDFQDFNGLDLLGKIKMYNYEWKEDKSRAYGVIAHELQSIIGYAVSGVKDGDTMQGVDYSKIVPVNTKAIQELHSLVLEQQAQINELKSQLNK